MTDDAPVKTQIRLPASLHQRLSAASEQSGRSFNAEMVYRLEKSFPAAIETQLLQARQSELARIQEEVRFINEEISELNAQLAQPSKRKIRGAINEAISNLARRQVSLQRMARMIEIDIDKFIASAVAEEELSDQ